VINLIWAGIARYLHLHGHRYLGGCVSVGLDDGGVTAATVWRTVAITHQAPPVFRVTPRRPWQLPVTAATATAAVPAGPVPPLLRGYLRLGAWICGDPGYDPDFGSADFYVLLDTDRIDARYWRHFLGSGPAQVGAGAQAVAARGPQ
jgi:putative hemolysin